MNKTEYVMILLKHRDNLANAKTFKEYQKANVAYCDWLIARYEADIHIEKAADKFMNNGNK